MSKFNSNPSLLCLLFAIHTGTLSAASLPDAVSGIDEVMPKVCRILELERNLYSAIVATGKKPDQLLGLSESDPDPKVQQVIRITKEIQTTKNEANVELAKVKTLVLTLNPEDQVIFNRQLLQRGKECLK